MEHHRINRERGIPVNEKTFAEIHQISAQLRLDAAESIEERFA